MDDKMEDKELMKIRLETLKTMIGKLQENNTSSGFSREQVASKSNSKSSNYSYASNTVLRTCPKPVNRVELNDKYKFYKAANERKQNEPKVNSLKAIAPLCKPIKRQCYDNHNQQANSRFKWDKNSTTTNITAPVFSANITSCVANQQAQSSNVPIQPSKFKLVKHNTDSRGWLSSRDVPASVFDITKNSTKFTNRSPMCNYNISNTKETTNRNITLFERRVKSSNLFKWRKQQVNNSPVIPTHPNTNPNHYTFLQKRYNFIRKATPIQMTYKTLAYILSQHRSRKTKRFKESFASRRLKFVRRKSIKNLTQIKNPTRGNATHTNLLNSPIKDMILSRHGTHYKVAGNLKSLRRISADGSEKKQTVGSKSIRNSNQYKFHRSFSSSVKRKVARNKTMSTSKRGAPDENSTYSAKSRVLKRSLTLAQRKKVNKTKFCLFFNRFGKCKRGNQCKYIHDPEKVAVCTRFLRGTCKDENCLFSHRIDPNKMPVCSFFLLGKCINEKCAYRHVNVSNNAEVCQDFLKGYCPRGEKCTQKHILECIEFITTGKCVLGRKCPMVHRFKPQVKRRRSSSVSGVKRPKGFTEKMRKPEGPVPIITNMVNTFISKDNSQPNDEGTTSSNTVLDSPLRNKGKLHLLPKFISDKISISTNNSPSFTTMRNLFNFENKNTENFTATSDTVKTTMANTSFIPLASSSDSDDDEKEKRSRKRTGRLFSFKGQDFIALD